MFSKFTVNSVVLLALTAFTVAVAVIFRNPLLVYTAVFLVVANVVLFIWAQLSVSAMQVSRLSPRLTVATKPVTINVTLTNRGRTPRFGTLGFDLHQQLTPGQDYSPVAFLDALPRVPAEAGYTVTPPRRGVFRIGPFYLYGGDPFGFYKCWSKREEYSELTVLPHPQAITFTRPPSTSLLRQDELETLPFSGDSTEFLGVREYMEGEPLRRVHWRSSARLGKLISRQYEVNVAAAVSALLLVDKSMLSGTPVDNPLEYSLTMIASLGHATLGERFHMSYLALMGEEHDTLSGTGRSFYEELAIRLARLKGHGPIDWERQSKIVLNYLPAGSSLIVFTADLGEETRGRLRRLAAHFRALTAVSFNQQSFAQARRPGSPGPQLSFGEGYLVFDVYYGDELQRVLDQVLGAPSLMRGRP